MTTYYCTGCNAELFPDENGRVTHGCPAGVVDPMHARVERLREWIAEQKEKLKNDIGTSGVEVLTRVGLDPMQVLLAGARRHALNQVLAILDGRPTP